MSRTNRRKIAEDTLQVIDQGHYTTSLGRKRDISADLAFAKANTRLYTPEDSSALLREVEIPSGKNQQVEVNGLTTLDAVRQLKSEGYAHIACLNFASAKNPGGGFLGGSQAQEESIARASGLYPCLLEASTYYEVNRKSGTAFYTDHMIYSPKIPVIKDETGSYLEEPCLVDILTAPAVNAGVVLEREADKKEHIKEVMHRRIRKALALFVHHQAKAIVLGAWGCGVFKNDPEEIASLFQEVIKQEYPSAFEKLVFAVYARNERFIRPFQKGLQYW